VQDLVIHDPVRRAELAARLWAKVDMPKAGSFRRCWTWKGAVTAAGDPRIQLDSTRGTLARRLVWTLYVAPPDVGLSATRYVTTTCGNLACLRPDHLRLMRAARGGVREKRRPRLQEVA
jgi:hypothetical protein